MGVGSCEVEVQVDDRGALSVGVAKQTGEERVVGKHVVAGMGWEKRCAVEEACGIFRIGVVHCRRSGVSERRSDGCSPDLVALDDAASSIGVRYYAMARAIDSNRVASIDARDGVCDHARLIELQWLLPSSVTPKKAEGDHYSVT